MGVRIEMEVKVWVLIAGFSRNFQLTIPSLLQKTVLPMKQSGNLAGLSIHLAEKHPVAREIVDAQARSILGEDTLVEFRTEAESQIDASIASQYNRVARRGNVYFFRRPEALHRSVFFLELLDRARIALGDNGFPLVFLRADLLQKTDASLVTHYVEAPNSVTVPDWHSWRGVNDRVAIIPNGRISAYLGRIRELDSYLTEQGIFHPEVFLAHALRSSQVERSIDAKYYRTRDGGTILEEDFSADSSRFAGVANEIINILGPIIPQNRGKRG